MKLKSPSLKHPFVLMILAGVAATGQGQTSNPNQNSAPEGWEGGGYAIHQSVEFGYRVSDVTGSQQMYNTLVNLRTGPRLLDQSLSMQSKNHDTPLFDNLFLNSFGWGGDPNNALRFRVDKNRWYGFRSAFRRDQTDFDYNLLANPLNPATSSPNIPVTASPHLFATRRRISDFDLTLFPQSIFDVRLGYSHNNMTGPSYSSVHEGTDALLFQDWNTTLDSYRFGADLKIFTHTVLSYDQFFDYYRGDTTWQLAPFAQALLPGGAGTVELGLPINTVNKNPCGINPPATSLIDATGTLTNLTCNSFLDYSRSNRIRTSSPTERVSLHTTDLARLELNASYAYSSADMSAPFNEFFNGFQSGRNGSPNTRQSLVTDTPGTTTGATRISNVADFSLTVHLTKHLRLVDTFRLWDYRIPERALFSEQDWTCTSCTLLTPISGTTTTGPAPSTTDALSFNQDWKRNEIDLVWDAAKHFGGRVGFRYGDREFHHVLDFTTGDEDRITVHEYTPVFTFWARPMQSLRFNFDWEHTNNDDTIVRIGPRKEDKYRVQANYTPVSWAVLGTSVNLWDASNADTLINYHGHNRNYGFTANLNPRQRIGFDLAYNYNDYQQNTFICFNNSDTSLVVVANAGSCTANGYSDSGNPLLTNGIYTSRTHYGMGSVTVRPVSRVSMLAGYSITSVGGETPQLNSLQPFGSLQYNYHQPLANVIVDIGHHISWKGSWNYYQYGEKSFVGPTDPRYFHANNATFSLLWGF
ncbi:MAG TPA: hypothetical protein VMG82_13485 [Candidatus Sulfotelmatobacter sp.]|nr:hypothetical protein [Candidatus Sulfotelmatobacter sp.]